MGAGRSFGMVLHREEGNLLVCESFDGVVIEVDVAQFHLRGIEGFHVHTKPVVL